MFAQTVRCRQHSEASLLFPVQIRRWESAAKRCLPPARLHPYQIKARAHFREYGVLHHVLAGSRPGQYVMLWACEHVTMRLGEVGSSPLHRQQCGNIEHDSWTGCGVTQKSLTGDASLALACWNPTQRADVACLILCIKATLCKISLVLYGWTHVTKPKRIIFYYKMWFYPFLLREKKSRTPIYSQHITKYHILTCTASDVCCWPSVAD